MALQGVVVLNSPVASADPTAQKAPRDGLLRDVPNDGVRFLADLAFGFCYPGGSIAGRPAAAAPANGALVADVSEHANASYTLLAGQAVGYAGGGFDMSALTARGSYIAVPASVAADIYTAYGGASQRFMVAGYVKLPAQADWNTTGSLAAFYSWAAAAAAAGVPDLLSMGQATGGLLTAIRQTAGATLANTSMVVPTADFGQLAQIAYWRNAAGVGLSLKTANARTTATGVIGAENSENFSASIGRVGVSTPYWGSPITGQANALKHRHYRMWVENLARSGRDPVTVLDADWARVQARIAASAAANGGTSLIFI